MAILLVVVVGVLIIVFANSIASRTGVAGPLILVMVGVVISFLPAVPAITIPPEVILVAVLPPLLFSAAVSAPAIEFRRDITAIGGLSVVLVVISALLLGLLFWWLIPGLGFALAVALGAILSPTDAVATSIVRRLGVPRRVVTILEGESLLNDASALVLLRTAVVAAAAGFSFLTTLGSFAWAVVSAIVVGAVAGLIALRLRHWTTSPTANTALGLTVPYLAYLPTEALGGSGLVAAVVAGVVCGQGSVRWLTPEQRISDASTWRTIEFLLEGAVFLIMGLELFAIVQGNGGGAQRLLSGLGIAALAFVLIVLVRAAYVMPMLRLHARRAAGRRRTRLEAARGAQTGRRQKATGRMRADIDYFDSSPLTWKHSTIVVWAGMRGAVTLAAAQTLPAETPQRDLLVFIAFAVAAGSLLVQGLTLPLLAKMLGLRKSGGAGPPRDEIREIDDDLRTTARAAVESGAIARPDGTAFPPELGADVLSRFVAADTPAGDAASVHQLELAVVDTMRARLHELGRSGRYSTPALRYILDELDAYEISVKLHVESEE
ncbi:sodium:proton antiporter [Microbacterium awajiense]|uniref:Sodium:proton antiporter n=1 Tax=Microbacterium awajiense TaxID=415214 RepID=A0ABP7AWJ6_9MICO